MAVLDNLLGLSRMLAVFVTFSWTLTLALFLSLLQFTKPLNKLIGITDPFAIGNAFLGWATSRMMVIGGVHIDIVGQVGNRKGVIYMYNHTSNLDPVIVYCIDNQSRFMYKKELRVVPLLGWVLAAYRHIVIDRKNREKSLAAINDTGYNILKANGSIMMAPEGTRSRTGELLPFKKGGFHLALQAMVPIVPIVLTGAAPLLPKHSARLVPGKVRMEALPDIIPREGETVDELLDRTRIVFANYKAPTLAPVDPVVAAAPSVLFWILMCVMTWYSATRFFFME